MLDVHPPHEAAHGWRDFFVHIATIVVGLLIAIGLEQTVEHIHQRYELRETREALERDLEANRADAARNAKNWRWEMAELQNDLLVLEYVRRHPGVPQDKLPGDLRWDEFPKTWHTAAWTNAQANGLVRLLPLEVANRNTQLYALFETVGKQNLDDWNAFNAAHRFDFMDGDPTHLTAPDLDSTIAATERALDAHMLVGYSLALLNNRFPELACPLTYDELDHMRHEPYRESQQQIAGPDRLTVQRMKSAGRTSW